MKVAIIGTVGVPACYGGFETLAENLVVRKKDPSIQYQVYCSSRSYKEKRREYAGAKLIYLPFKANGWQSVFYDTLCMVHAYFTSDVILALGPGGCQVKPLLNLFRRRKFVVNYDGIDCGRAKWNPMIQAYIAFSGWFAAKVCDAGISDNAAIQENVERKYRKKSALIEYGGDNAAPVRDDERLSSHYGLRRGAYFFSVARIEPENHIHTILEAAKRCPNETFVIVGNWAHSAYGRDLKAENAALPNVKLFDPIYEPEEINLLRSNCRCYLHGHSVGGTNPTLVEAMSLGLPLIAFDVIYNRKTTEEAALYFSTAESLANLIEHSDDESFTRIAQAMKTIADRRYRWDIICEKYEQLLKETR